MTIATTIRAQGPGWRVTEVDCTAGPADPVIEEQHEAICMAVVLSGTFDYRSSQGRATLAPGAVLLGNAGDCFACGHEHSVGDRCLAFHLESGYYEDVLSSIPRATKFLLPRPCLPPNQATARLGAIAEAEVAWGDADALEELALSLVGTVAALVAGLPAHTASRDTRGTRRIQEIVRLIDENVESSLPLAWLAREAAMSPFHFLREFRSEVGVTPYQYLLGRRLRRAALRLRQSDEPVLSVALNSGFNDVSEFNRRFKRLMGLSPTQFRTCDRPPLADADPFQSARCRR